MFRNDIFDEFNNIFANFDVLFRDFEKSHNRRGLLPSVSIPSVKLTYDDTRVYGDNDKTVHYKNGMLHREDGPAVVYNKEGKEDEYWLEGKRVSKEDVDKFQEKIEENKTHYLYVDNKEYKILGKKKLEEVKKLLMADDVPKLESISKAK